MKGQALMPIKRREERKNPCLPSSKKGSLVERTGPGYPEAAKGSRSSRHATQLG